MPHVPSRPLLALALAFLPASPALAGGEDELEAAIRGLTAAAEAPLRPLFPLAREEPSPAAVAYFRHYGLSFPAATHHFGVVEAGEHRLAAHVFVPARPRGTVVVLHGYYDHAGILSRLIGFLVGTGFAVAAFDLPGHGLSTGERATIGDFAQYVDALAVFAAACRRHLPGPYHFVGHSTGAAVALDHVLSAGEGAFDEVVLLAPLVRSYGWKLSRVGGAIARPFTDEVPRVFRKNSGDEEFLDFVAADPLQYRGVPLSWAAALERWNERIESLPPSDEELLVIQGTDDTTIDWEHNLDVIRRLLPRARIEVLDGARHHLANESAAIREWVFALIRERLERDQG